MDWSFDHIRCGIGNLRNLLLLSLTQSYYSLTEESIPFLTRVRVTFVVGPCALRVVMANSKPETTTVRRPTDTEKPGRLL